MCHNITLAPTFGFPNRCKVKNKIIFCHVRPADTQINLCFRTGWSMLSMTTQDTFETCVLQGDRHGTADQMELITRRLRFTGQTFPKPCLSMQRPEYDKEQELVRGYLPGRITLITPAHIILCSPADFWQQWVDFAHTHTHLGWTLLICPRILAP